MRPLEGITVVALEQVIAGPFATRQLAELGARVIKIERPGSGDASRGYDRTVRGLSSHFVWTNRSKESLTLDVKHPDAKAVLNRLLEKADVFLQNLAPGAAERLGLGSEMLRKKHPRLIWCGISGYGPAGPYAEKKAYDLLVQCEAGLLSITGTPDAPSKAGIPVADIAAGMYAFSSILAALFRRSRDGEGATLDITMFESLGEWMGFPAYFTASGGEPPPRSGAHHATIAPYGPFGTGDGGSVFLSVQNEREFERFCDAVLSNPALKTDARFSRRRVNAACLRENFVQLQFQVRARHSVDEDKAKLGFEALRNQHFSSGQSKKMSPKVRSHVLLGGLDFAQRDLVQIGFHLPQYV